MTLSPQKNPVWEKELSCSKEVAKIAGELVLSYADAGVDVEYKAGDEPVTVADREASEQILTALRTSFPEDILISEEAIDNPDRLTQQRVWYIDPIDGTKDFIAGKPGYAVMIGLTVGASPVLGVVYQPQTQTLYWGANGVGAFAQTPQATMPLQVSGTTNLADANFVASQSNRTQKIDQVKDALGIQKETNIGSVGLKLCRISRGQNDLYVNPYPRCKKWDTCAPEAILQAAGGSVSDLFGQPLRYDTLTLDHPRGILASNSHIHKDATKKLVTLFGAGTDLLS